MSLQVLRKIAALVQDASFYTVVVDETTDVSNSKQVVICLRWVDVDFQVHEDFVGMYKMPTTDAATLYSVIMDVPQRLNLPVCKARGQCYDGAAAMAGVRSGVAARILCEEKRAVFTHCYGHSLNLACNDAVKQCKVIKNALETVHEVTKLVKKSPGREAIFKTVKSQLAPDTPGIRLLSPTRWTA